VISACHASAAGEGPDSVVAHFLLAATNWVSPTRPASDPTVRLLCFPYAGGSGAIFHSWQYLSPHVGIWTVNLPGRGERFREASVPRMSQVVEAIAAEVSEASEKPFVFLATAWGPGGFRGGTTFAGTRAALPSSPICFCVSRAGHAEPQARMASPA